MFWIPIMMAAAAMMQKQQASDAAKTQNKMNAANTDIANIQQAGSSSIASAKGALNRMNQSIQTRDALKGAGEQWNQIQSQKAKLGEQMTTGSFMNRVQAAEQAGAIAARSSAAGVGGSTVGMLESTMQLRADMVQADMDQQYSDNYWAMGEAETDNIYGQYGVVQQQNVFLDDVAASSITGPAKLPTGSWGQTAITGAMAYMGAASSTGEFSKGGSMDMSNSGAKLKSWFSSSPKSTSAGVGANSFFQLGGKT